MTDLTVVPVTPDMTIFDRSHGQFTWDNSESISGGLCILRWGICGSRQASYMHNDPFPAHGCLEVQRAIDQDFLLQEVGNAGDSKELQALPLL